MTSAKKAAAGSRPAAAMEIPVNDASNFTMECPTDRFLSRLESVRQVGPNRWTALCQSHDDGRPSLAIKEVDDGRVLIHCFSGCGVDEIVASVGLSLSDLFPDRPMGHCVKPERRPWPATDVLKCTAFEGLVCASAVATLMDGRPFSDADRARAMQAAARLQEAAKLAGVAP
jgi:hypothetical protein